MRDPEDKKQRIMHSAIKVIAEKGYNGASTALIAKEAGVSQGIIFHYFGNKEELFWTMIKDKAELFEKELKKNLKDEKDALKKIEVALNTFAKIIEKEEEFYEVVIKQIRGSGLNLEKLNKIGVMKFAYIVNELIEEGIEQGVVRKIDAEIASICFFGMIDFNAFRWFLSKKDFSLEQTAKAIVDIFVNGIKKK
jgi:TetR/AcrR family transcriptional regulator